MNYKPRFSAEQREASMAKTQEVTATLPDPVAARAFNERLPKRSAEAFIIAGLDAPERLLFMSKAEIAALPGIGAAALRDAEAYRARFVR